MEDGFVHCPMPRCLQTVDILIHSALNGLWEGFAYMGRFSYVLLIGNLTITVLVLQQMKFGVRGL